MLQNVIDYDELHIKGAPDKLLNGQLEFYFLASMPDLQRQSLKKKLSRAYTFLYQQVYPYTFPPVSVVVVDDHPKLGLAQKNINREAMVWPLAWEPEQALWFFAHEATEAFIVQTFGATAPRWLIETFAQLGAHRLAEKIDEDALRFGREELEARGFVSLEVLKSWGRPQFSLKVETIEDFEALDPETLYQMAQAYNNTEHATDIESRRYATAWKFGIETLPRDKTIGEAIEFLRQHINDQLFTSFSTLRPR